MILKNYLLKVYRKKLSYDYKFNLKKNDYNNNIKNNSLDKMVLFYLEKLNENVIKENYLIEIPNVQTVSNHPHFDHFDTIAAGPFSVELFVTPRKFHGLIHGIIDAIDIEGQKIDHWSMQVENGYQKGRWLIHDKWSFEKQRDLNFSYSGGCFISSSENQKKLNNKFKKLKFQKGDILPGLLVEVD